MIKKKLKVLNEILNQLNTAITFLENEMINVNIGKGDSQIRIDKRRGSDLEKFYDARNQLVNFIDEEESK